MEFKTAPRGVQLVAVYTTSVLFSLTYLRLPSFNQIRTTHHRGQSPQETVAVDFTTAPLAHIHAAWKLQTLEAKAVVPQVLRSDPSTHPPPPPWGEG